jgi:uncharacterized glyoxalase superfamily protein PhnB
MDEPTFTAGVYYRDPKAAISWLERAFGFEVTMAIDGPPDDPTQCHYELGHRGKGRLMVGGQWAPWARSPSTVDGVNTQSVHVQLDDDIDAHCAHARAEGATIVAEPADQFYGDRTYRALDVEGHVWTFAQHVRDVSKADAEAALGAPIVAKHWK